MKRFITVLSALVPAVLLFSCIGKNEDTHSLSITGVADSVFVDRADEIWHMTLVCGDCINSLGSDVVLELNLESGTTALESRSFTCAPDGSEQTPGTFHSTHYKFKGDTLVLPPLGSYIANNAGNGLMYYPVENGKLTVIRNGDLYDLKFNSSIGEGSSIISFSFEAENMAFKYVGEE